MEFITLRQKVQNGQTWVLFLETLGNYRNVSLHKILVKTDRAASKRRRPKNNSLYGLFQGRLFSHWNARKIEYRPLRSCRCLMARKIWLFLLRNAKCLFAYRLTWRISCDFSFDSRSKVVRTKDGATAKPRAEFVFKTQVFQRSSWPIKYHH